MTKEERFNVVVNYAFGGWHHVEKREACGNGGVKFYVWGTLSTFDFTVLTKLVLAAHAMRVRAEVGQAGPKKLKIWLHLRENKPDSWSEHHPSLDDLIADAQVLKVKFPVETIIT